MNWLACHGYKATSWSLDVTRQVKIAFRFVKYRSLAINVLQ